MEAKSGGGGGKRRSRTSDGGAVERKEIERRRRNDMKFLCVKLSSLVPKEHRSKSAMTQVGSLDDAAAYIMKLKERVGELQRRRSSAMQLMASGGAAGSDDLARPAEEVPPPAPPAVVDVRQHDDSLEVVLVCSAGTGRRPFKLHEVVAVLEEEGADVVSANYSVAGDKIFYYTIHSRAFNSRIAIDVSRVSERLRALSKRVPAPSCDPRVQSPMSSLLVQQARRDWSALGSKNHQIIPSHEIIPARNAHHDDMGMIPLSSRSDGVSAQPSHGSDAGELPSAPWGPGDYSSRFAYDLDNATPSYPYLPTVHEEPSSSSSEDAEHDLLLGIDWLQTTGQAVPEWELQAITGYPDNGTTCGIPLF